MGMVFGACLLIMLIILWGVVILKELDPESRPGPIHVPCSLLREFWMPVISLFGPHGGFSP